MEQDEEENGGTHWIISGGDPLELGTSQPTESDEIPAPWEI